MNIYFSMHKKRLFVQRYSTMMCCLTLLAASAGYANPAATDQESAKQTDITSILQKAYQHRPEIQTCVENLKASAQEIKQAAAGFLPKADIGWQRGRREQDRGDQIFENRELNIAVPVFRGGRTVFGYKGAKLIYNERLERCRETEQVILNETAQSYVDLAFNHAILDYHKQNTITLDRVAQRVKRLAKYGQAVHSDVLLADAETSYADAEYQDALRQVDVANKKIFYFTGMNVASADFPDIDGVILTDEAEANKALSEQHPSLRAARAFAEASKYATKAEKAGFLPTADIIYNKSKQESPLFVQGDLEFSTYTFSVNVPLFAGGGNLAAYRRQKHLRRAALHDISSLEISLKNDLAENIRTFVGAERSLNARLKGVKAAEISSQGIRREYREGLRPLTDVLQSEKDVLLQRRNTADERRRRLSAYYDMMALTGSMTPERFNIATDYPEYTVFSTDFLMRKDEE